MTSAEGVTATSDSRRTAAVLQPSSTLISSKCCYGGGSWQNVGFDASCTLTAWNMGQRAPTARHPGQLSPDIRAVRAVGLNLAGSVVFAYY